MNTAKLLTQGAKNEQERRNTKDERDESIRAIFDMFDKNGDGKLMNDELDKFIRALGREPSEDEVARIIEKADTDGNGYITFDEFLSYMDDVYVMSPDQIDDLVEAFKIFDVDKSGSISLQEFRNILTKYGKTMFTDQDIIDIFDMIDLDGDGNVNYAEFIDMWKYQ